MKALLEPSGLEVTEVKKAVCLPLSRRVEVGLVSPAAWDQYDLCRRQFSWYRHSPRLGQTLVVSSLPLPDIAPAPNVIIRNGSFLPPRLPTPEELRTLMGRASYREARPEEWEKIGAVDREEQARWMKVMGLQGILDDYTLELVFENGEKRIFDMNPFFGKKPFSKLRNSPLFFKASVGFGTVVWPRNIDIAPETLWSGSVPT